MKVSFEFDLDPRYGWACIDLEGETTALIVIHTSKGSIGFNYNEKNNSMLPTCLCNAWDKHECSCINLENNYWR